MAKEAAVQEPPRSLQVHPSRVRPRADADRHARHAFLTLTGGASLTELTLDDILEVNWNGVKTSIQDAIVRVRYEGDLSSDTVRDVIRLLALALRKLDVADGEIVQRLETTPGIGFWGWMLSLLPTEGSRRLRAIRTERGRLKRKRRELDEHHDEIFGLRIELAEEIDRKIGAMLAAKDAEYRDLLEKLQVFQATHQTAKAVLDDLTELERLEVQLEDPYDKADSDVLKRKISQIIDKIPSYIIFCRRNGGDYVQEREDVLLFVREMASELDAKAAPIEQVMQAKREAWKQELYAEAAGDTQP